jgi:hypothetical protein
MSDQGINGLIGTINVVNVDDFASSRGNNETYGSSNTY